MARKEKELHLQLYPGWSARDNYASHNKKKKRKKENTNEPRGVNGAFLSPLFFSSLILVWLTSFIQDRKFMMQQFVALYTGGSEM